MVFLQSPSSDLHAFVSESHFHIGKLTGESILFNNRYGQLTPHKDFGCEGCFKLVIESSAVKL